MNNGLHFETHPISLCSWISAVDQQALFHCGNQFSWTLFESYALLLFPQLFETENGFNFKKKVQKAPFFVSKGVDNLISETEVIHCFTHFCILLY